MILSNEYDRLIVEDRKTGGQIAVITKDKVITANNEIAIRLKPSPNAPKKHKYRIETDGESTEVFLDGKPIPGIRRCEFSHSGRHTPTLSIDLFKGQSITLNDGNEPAWQEL